MKNALEPAYAIKPIASQFVDSAYPAISIAIPQLTQTEWRRFCGDLVASPAAGEQEIEREEVFVALNARRYVKGVCIFSVRDHRSLGRLLDVPAFVVAGAADSQRATFALLQFLKDHSETRFCSGIRFWFAVAEVWERRNDPHYIHAADCGSFTPAGADLAQLHGALNSRAVNRSDVSDRPAP